jgi:hypothetical protein
MNTLKYHVPFLPNSALRWITYISIGLFIVILALAIHEIGHVIGASILGWDVTKIYLWGFSVLPEFSFVGFSDGYIGYTVWSSLETPTSFERGFVLIMGSGLTLLVSMISIFTLYLLKTKSFFIQTVLFFLSLLYLDMVTYTFGLRPSGDSEPLDAARLFGIADSFWMIFIVSLFLIFSSLIALYFLYFKKQI